MRYMMIIHHDEAALAEAPQQQLWAEYAAFNQALAKAGAGFAAGERLGPSKRDSILHSRAGKTAVLDGPYADTQEQLAGYFFIDVASLEQAVEWASRCPSAKYGAIEIRPIVEPGQG